MVQVLAEAIPGQGARRAGGDIAAGAVIASGQQLRPLDLLIARAAGLHTMNVRRLRLRVVNIPAPSDTTALLIAESARAAGAEVVFTEASARDAQSIANAIDASVCDVLVTIGGTGVGRTDATVAALASRGALVAQGVALQPGRTTAIGKIGHAPVIALSGAPDQALAGWWTLAMPVLERLAAAQSRPVTTLPLARKIASGVGIAEVILLGKADNAWMPLASGDLSLDAIAHADAWLLVSGGNEGFAAGTPVDAYMLRNQL